MRRYLFRPDLSAEIGIGHAMRSVALAERMVARGDEVVFACDTSTTPWVGAVLGERGIGSVGGRWDGADLVDLLRAVRPHGVVIDSYTLPTDAYEAVMHLGVPTLSIVDNELRGARGHLLLDQNIGSECDWATIEVPDDARLLAGLEFAMIRQQIRDLRPSEPPVARAAGCPRVLAFFGGSDAMSVGPAIAGALTSLRRPVDATVITRPDLIPRGGQAETSWPGGGRIVFSPPVDDLPRLVRAADLVVSAAGSSCWELAALGAATALIPVADNQMVSYRRVTDAGAAAGLGSLQDLRRQPAAIAESLSELLDSVEARQRLQERSWALVDGRGADRVLEALDGVRL